jgi:hypothetical protein
VEQNLHFIMSTLKIKQTEFMNVLVAIFLFIALMQNTIPEQDGLVFGNPFVQKMFLIERIMVYFLLG